MNAENQNNETFQNEHPATPLMPVEQGLPQGASRTQTTQNAPSKPKANPSPKVRQLEDAKTPQDSVLAKALEQEPAKYEFTDFMSCPKFIKNSRHLSRVQDIVTKLGVKMRVPKIDRSFVPYAESIVSDGTYSNFGNQYSIQSTISMPNPNGPANFADPAYNAPQTAKGVVVNVSLLPQNQDLVVKWNSDVNQVLLTAISTNRWDWLKNGTRQNRAAPQANVTDVTVLFSKDLDISHGTIDTALVAHWMYDSFTHDPNDLKTLHVININDLATYMNNSPNNIISNKAILLDLSTNFGATPVADNVISKCMVFEPDNNIIINIGAPVVNNANYSGCPCRDVVCNTDAARLDQDVGLILDRTLDEQTVEFAFWCNLQHLFADGYAQANAQNSLKTFRADFQDQLIRYHSRPEPSLGVFDSSVIPLYQVVFTYRCLKTILINLALKRYGLTPGFASAETSGRTVDSVLFKLQYLNTWYYSFYNPNQAMDAYTPVWIPYEFINNNAQPGWKLDLDGTQTIYGTRLVFKDYHWPRSIFLGLANYTYRNVNNQNDCPDYQRLNNIQFNYAFPLTARHPTANNHVQSFAPGAYSHTKLYRVDNSAWDETTRDNVVVEELTF